MTFFDYLIHRATTDFAFGAWLLFIVVAFTYSIIMLIRTEIIMYGTAKMIKNRRF